AALAVLVLLVHDDGAVLDLDAPVGRCGHAVERLALGPRVAPAGQVLAVEQRRETRLGLGSVLGAAGGAGKQAERKQCEDKRSEHFIFPLEEMWLNSRRSVWWAVW